MPIAPIDEHGDSRLGEHHVGRTPKLRHGPHGNPITQTLFMKYGSKNSFRFRVPTLVRPHRGPRSRRRGPRLLGHHLLRHQTSLMGHGPGLSEIGRARREIDLTDVSLLGATALRPPQVGAYPSRPRVDTESHGGPSVTPSPKSDRAAVRPTGGPILFSRSRRHPHPSPGPPRAFGGGPVLPAPLCALRHAHPRPSASSRADATARAKTSPNLTGTALPSCRICSPRGPARAQSSGKVMTRAVSRTVI